MTHRVRVSFDRPEDLVIDLTEEEWAAANDEWSWEEFYELLYDRIAEHFAATGSIDNVREL